MKHKKLYSVSMFWNKRDMNQKTKQSSISITINLPRQQFRVNLKLTSTKAEFDLALSSTRKISDDIRDLRNALNDYMTKAENILNKMPELSRDSFVRLFKSETDLFLSNKTDVLFFYKMKMDEAKKEGRVSAYGQFKLCMNDLSVYSPNICFESIDERWLKNYSLYLKGKGNSDATIGIKLICLRQIFNVARKQKFIPDHCYPFKTFPISSSPKSKAVLYPAQLKLLYEYEPIGLVESRAKAYFFFCYLGNGMNFKDMTMLRFKDIQNDSFTFIREKTKVSCRSGIKEIRVHLHDDMKRIISEYGNPSNKPDDYVFPVLKQGTDLMRQHRDRCRHKRYVNNKLTAIGKKLGFDVHLCLNLARHSFATMLKISGTATSHIGDAMGHTSTKTTEIYMKSLPSESMKQLSNQLLAFN